jgi:hypothetical protein
MELSKQVVSLPLAKKLKELGVKQESYFSFYKRRISNEDLMLRYGVEPHDEFFITNTNNVMGRWSDFVGAAFTVAELGEMLPGWVHSQKWIDATLCRWAIFTHNEPKEYREDKVKEIMSADTEADARAMFLIHLIENKLVRSEPEAGT